MISVISAVIAVLGAITTAALGYRVQTQLKSREHMDYMGRYRDSLLWAAFDLQSRIYNILRGFEVSRRPGRRGFLGAFLVEGTERQANYVIPEGAGPCQAAGMQSFVPVFRRLRACRAGPRASLGAWRALFPDSCRSLVSGPGGGQGPGVSLAGGAGAAGVLDAPGREPIIGRRGTGGCVVVVAAGPMGSSGAGAPGCGHPSG
jgi:hypothetical protein